LFGQQITGKPGLNYLENLTYLSYHDSHIVIEYVIFQVGFLLRSLIWVLIYIHAHQESVTLRKMSSEHIYQKC